MANICEPLSSRRDRQHAEEAERHEPKGAQSGRGSVFFPRAAVELPAVRRGHVLQEWYACATWEAQSFPQGMWKVARKGSLEDEGVWEVGVSECRSVIDGIGVRALPCPERGLTSDWSWITRKVWNS